MECGIDVVKITRMEKLSQNPLFFEKYFTDEEVEYIQSKSNKIETFAGLFACKEALLKALGLGIGNGIDLKDINIKHNNSKPQVEVSAKIDYYLSKVGCSQISVSISHDGDIAIAMCILM